MMQTFRAIAVLSTMSFVAIACPLGGCDTKSEPTPKAPTGGTPKSDGHDHAHDDGHDHGHGPTIQLGEQAAGGFTIKASRDGAIKPGSDAAFDVWVTGGAAKVAAVRFWIGAQDAKGSVKAKAELEKDTWHSHAEVPNPLPTDSKLWVEVETDKGEKSVVGFDLKS